MVEVVIEENPVIILYVYAISGTHIFFLLKTLLSFKFNQTTTQSDRIFMRPNTILLYEGKSKRLCRCV